VQGSVCESSPDLPIATLVGFCAGALTLVILGEILDLFGFLGFGI
jgi:hypothetical protein